MVLRSRRDSSASADIAGLILTFLAVVIAWVFFRADNMPAALNVLSKMADPSHIAFGRAEIAYALFILGYAAIAWFAPNTQEIMGYDHQQPEGRRASRRDEDAAAAPLRKRRRAGFGILGIQQHSEFIYFRF